MGESRHEFNGKLMESVKQTPILWDSHLDDSKLSEKKPALWLEIADKNGSSAGRPIHCAQISSCLQFGFQYAMTKVRHHKCPPYTVLAIKLRLPANFKQVGFHR